MMLSTGNVQNYLRKLQTELRFIKFRDVDYKSLQTGNPCELLKIYHYVFLDYNPLFAKKLLDKCKCDLYGKTDSHFVDTMYKALRDYFNYKPSITREQFFTTSFAERKLQMACDVINLVRQECKEMNTIQQQPKRSGSSSARLSNGNKEKKRVLSSTQQPHVPNVFHPLRDMGLEGTVRKDRTVDDFVSMEQQQLGSHPDESEFELPSDHHHQTELNESMARMTINRLEEQIQILKVKVDGINERLNNITSILQETHLGNGSITSSDIVNLNARLVIVENELSILRRKSSSNNENPVEFKQKQSVVPQGILVESDEEENMIRSYAIEEPIKDFDIVGRARSLIENVEQCNRDLLKTLETK